MRLDVDAERLGVLLGALQEVFGTLVDLVCALAGTGEGGLVRHLDDVGGETDVVEMRHFRQTIDNVRPTFTDDIGDYYERMKDEFRTGGPDPQERRSGRRVGFQ